jgi:hypothetical protein
MKNIVKSLAAAALLTATLADPTVAPGKRELFTGGTKARGGHAFFAKRASCYRTFTAVIKHSPSLI